MVEINVNKQKRQQLDQISQATDDLENRIDNHNKNVGGMDQAIKVQIENLTRS